MARPLRIDVPDGWYHVMAHGIEGRTIFDDDRDRWHFIDLLAMLPERFRVIVHAYVCMGSHYHIILQTPDANLSQAMHWFNVSYSAWYNVRHSRRGPLFQGRFKSVWIEDGAWAHALSIYVHLNPLRIKALGLGKRDRAAAGVGQGKHSSEEILKERLRRLREYRWSSYQAYAGYSPIPAWLTVDAILSRAARKTSRQVSAYRRTVRTRLVEGVDPDSLEILRDSVAIGSPDFVSRVRRGHTDFDRETAGKRDLRRGITFEEVVQAMESVCGEAWETVLHRRGDQAKWLVLRLARRYTGMTLAELGVAAGGMDYAAVGMALRRLNDKLETTPALCRVESQIVKMLNVET